MSTISTNGRVEPVVNYQIYSPIATTVKAVYVQPGDMVAAGKLLMVLDDMEARARVASAESGVKAAQAALEAATHNGSQQERQMAAADMARAQAGTRRRRRRPGRADQAERDRRGLAKRGGRGAAAAGYGRSQPSCVRAERAAAAIRRQRSSGRRPRGRRGGQSDGGAAGTGADRDSCSGCGDGL